MSEPELGSVEFFAKYYPNAKENTCRKYKSILSNLKNWIGRNPVSSVSGWLDEAEGNVLRWKERFLFLRKFADIYWKFDATKYNTTYLEYMEKCTMGQNLTVTCKNEPQVLEKSFKELDEIYAKKRKLPVALDSIFGAYLPPRRMDVYGLEIRDSDTNDKINYFNKTTNEFVFNNSKEKNKGPTNRFPILKLLPLYEDKNILFSAAKWLSERPNGKLFPYSRFEGPIKRWYGHCNNSQRKYWASKFDKSGSMEQRILLRRWMNHSADVCQTNYIVEKDPGTKDDLISEEPLWENIHETELSQPKIPLRQPKKIVKTVYEYYY